MFSLHVFCIQMIQIWYSSTVFSHFSQEPMMLEASTILFTLLADCHVNGIIYVIYFNFENSSR